MKEEPIKIYRSDAYYIPVRLAPDSLIEATATKFTRRSYIEAKCAKCPYLEDRHSENCDVCDGFQGVIVTGGVVTKNNQEYLKIPRGGRAFLRRHLKATGRLDSAVFLDKRPEERPMSSPIKFIATLNDYQVEPVRLIAESTSINGVIKAPPRTGKTVIACAAICELGQKTLILAAQTEWLKQFRETFIGSETQDRMTDAEEHQIGFPKKLSDFDKYDVCLCTLSMFKSDKGKELLSKLTRKFPVVFIDEVHYVPAKESAKVIAGVNARWIVGLTGTTERKIVEEYKIVEDIVGKVLIEIEVERARPTIELLEMPKGKKNEFQIKGHGNYAFTALVGRLESSTPRRVAICKEAIKRAKEGHLVIIGLTRVQSILDYTREINALTGKTGFALPFHGELKPDARMEIVGKARRYKCRVLVGNIKLVSVGLNIPRASCIIESGINNNAPACKQRLARVLTPMPDKPNPLIIYTLDESDIIARCRRTEFWNTVVKTFKPIIKSEVYSRLKVFFSQESSSVKSRKGKFSYINPKDML